MVGTLGLVGKETGGKELGGEEGDAETGQGVLGVRLGLEASGEERLNEEFGGTGTGLARRLGGVTVNQLTAPLTSGR